MNESPAVLDAVPLVGGALPREAVGALSRSGAGAVEREPSGRVRGLLSVEVDRGAGAEWDAEQVPHDEQGGPGRGDQDGVGEHDGYDRSDAGVTVVAFGDDDDQREVRH